MTIEVETGPMYSGKSSALKARIEAHEIAENKFGKDFLTFNHTMDDRYGEGVLSNHNGEQKPAIGVCKAEDILIYIGGLNNEGEMELEERYQELTTIFIDEGQFFEGDLAMVAQFLDEKWGIDVSVAGLDTNFKAEPFSPMPEVMAVADEVRKHTAVCKYKNGDEKVCGGVATRTQRVVDGKPANYEDEEMVVGAQETYEARCKKHHVVPGKSNPLGKKRD